jgi:hypothetical protein
LDKKDREDCAFRNKGCLHWIYVAIFINLQIIWAFESFGGGGGQGIKDLYQWLQEMMKIAGKHMNVNKWCLYTTHDDTTRQPNSHDWGFLYILMFGLCVGKLLPLKIITRECIVAAGCLLLLHLINIQPDSLPTCSQLGRSNGMVHSQPSIPLAR